MIQQPFTIRSKKWLLRMKRRQRNNFGTLNIDVSLLECMPNTWRDGSRTSLPNKYVSFYVEYDCNYSLEQIMIIDGEELKSDPVSVMTRIQMFLKVDPMIDYSKQIRFNTKKGFFCPVSLPSNSTKCLGKGKGRKYPDMMEETEKFLREYYMPGNVALSKLLTKLRQPIPIWLEQDLSHQEI